MVTKEYRLTQQYKAEIHVVVDGIPMDLPFHNGEFNGGVRRNGYYTTSNPAIQEALESNELYKTMYVISRVKDTSTFVKTEPKAIVGIGNGDAITSYSGITNSQKARIILLEKVPGLTTSMLLNKDNIRAIAAQNNISFPDWT